MQMSFGLEAPFPSYGMHIKATYRLDSCYWISPCGSGMRGLGTLPEAWSGLSAVSDNDYSASAQNLPSRLQPADKIKMQWPC